MDKPIMHINLDGPQGNVFYILGLAAVKLRISGGDANTHAIEEMRQRVFKCKTYEDAIGVIREYVDIKLKKKEGGVPM